MPKQPSEQEHTEAVSETPVEGFSINVVPVGPVQPDAPPPTLDQAFMTLCEAMVAQLEEDLPLQQHVEEIIGWYVNGNEAISWQHAIVVLEQVLQVRLRG